VEKSLIFEIDYGGVVIIFFLSSAFPLKRRQFIAFCRTFTERERRPGETTRARSCVCARAYVHGPFVPRPSTPFFRIKPKTSETVKCPRPPGRGGRGLNTRRGDEIVLKREWKKPREKLIPGLWRESARIRGPIVPRWLTTR